MPPSTPLPDLASPAKLSLAQIESLLTLTSRSAIDKLRRKAVETTLAYCGQGVAYRGIIEFSNICRCNCRYCGIRASNSAVTRYQLTREQILDQARWCADQGFGSLLLQSGERRDAAFIDFVVDVVKAIKAETRSTRLPRGLGITLCVGEQARDTYARFFEAGAHRYLLRIETSSPALFARWHPPEQRLETRLGCLQTLRAIGYQVGTGVMIGAPWQTAADLAADVCFFREQDMDMICMGPYLPHHAAPMAAAAVPSSVERLRLVLLTIAVVRLVLRDVNIAATTALQALAPLGREMGLSFGANEIMLQATPPALRRSDTHYDSKSFADDTDPAFQESLASRILRMGRRPVRDQWNDAPHARARRAGRRSSRRVPSTAVDNRPSPTP